MNFRRKVKVIVEAKKKKLPVIKKVKVPQTGQTRINKILADLKKKHPDLDWGDKSKPKTDLAHTEIPFREKVKDLLEADMHPFYQKVKELSRNRGRKSQSLVDSTNGQKSNQKTVNVNKANYSAEDQELLNQTSAQRLARAKRPLPKATDSTVAARDQRLRDAANKRAHRYP